MSTTLTSLAPSFGTSTAATTTSTTTGTTTPDTSGMSVQQAECFANASDIQSTLQQAQNAMYSGTSSYTPAFSAQPYTPIITSNPVLNAPAPVTTSTPVLTSNAPTVPFNGTSNYGTTNYGTNYGSGYGDSYGPSSYGYGQQQTYTAPEHHKKHKPANCQSGSTPNPKTLSIDGGSVVRAATIAAAYKNVQIASRDGRIRRIGVTELIRRATGMKELAHGEAPTGLVATKLKALDDRFGNWAWPSGKNPGGLESAVSNRKPGPIPNVEKASEKAIENEKGERSEAEAIASEARAAKLGKAVEAEKRSAKELKLDHGIRAALADNKSNRLIRKSNKDFAKALISEIQTARETHDTLKADALRDYRSAIREAAATRIRATELTALHDDTGALEENLRADIKEIEAKATFEKQAKKYNAIEKVWSGLKLEGDDKLVGPKAGKYTAQIRRAYQGGRVKSFFHMFSDGVVGKALKGTGTALGVAAPVISAINGVCDFKKACRVVSDPHASLLKKTLSVSAVGMDGLGTLGGPVGLVANISSIGVDYGRDHVQ